MATPTIIKQSLELSKALIIGTETVTDSDKEQMIALAQEVLNLLQGLKSPSSNKVLTGKTPENHPIDTLLKKGKVELPEGRYKQLIQIHDQLTIFKIKFLSAKQNQNVTWFPLEWNGDKSAALYLSSSEWSIAPIKYRDDNDLTGEWEGFDLTEFMSMNCPEFDQDEY